MRDMLRHASVGILALALGLAGCRQAGRPTNRSQSRPGDAGVVVPDSGAAPVDAGFVDTGVVEPPPDSGVTPTPDAGFADAGFRDGGVLTGDEATVYQLQDPSRGGHPAVDSRVRLVDVIVTAVVPAGGTAGSFWVQEAAGGPYSGILVFRPTSVPETGVQVGDRVTLTGTYTEYFDLSEVILETLDTVVPGGVPPVPARVSALSLANGSSEAEQWEGVLVRVESVTVLDDMPDAPDDFGEWVVTGGLRVDDQLYRFDPRPSVGTVIQSMVGVHHYGFENYKVLPRAAADVVY
jgi:hypothetical protein